MDWPIKINFSQDYLLDASLSLHEVDGEIMLEFVNTLSTETLLLDRLLSFNTIEFDDFHPLHVRFRGDCNERTFRFITEDAIASVWMILQRYVDLVSLPGKSKVFRIIPKAKKQQIELIPSFLKSKSIPIKRDKSIPEALSSGLLRESLSDLRCTTVNETNIACLYIDNVWQIKLYEIDVADGFQFDLWKRILCVSISGKDVERYQTCCNLWRNVQKYQWERHSSMRNFVKSLEYEIPIYVKNSVFKKMVYEVLMSFFMAYYGDTFEYKQSFVEFLDFLMKLLIACDDGEDSFCCRNGEKLNFEETSVLLFTVFSRCYDLLMDVGSAFCQMPDRSTLFTDTLRVLEEQSPATAQLLKTHGIENFDFLHLYIDSFFMAGRSEEDSVLIFTAILSMARCNLPTFMKCFMASTLILLHTRLENSQIDSPQTFMELYLSLLSTVNVRLLLFNVDQIMDLYSLESSA